MNLSGSWCGELDGTNKGRMVINLKQEGNRVYGKGNFNEPTLGVYEYNVQGVVFSDELKLMLTPAKQYYSKFQLGNIEATAHVNSPEEIKGKWSSSLGTAGTFKITREQAMASNKQSGDSSLDMDISSKSVFIVHGHDDAAKEKVARFIEKLGLEAIILHEQVSKGLTIYREI